MKGFVQGINRVIPPEQTCKVVLRKIQNIDPLILKGYFEVPRPSKILQYRFIGTDYYQQIVQAEGTNGKGHFKEQALASGIMEMVERYSCYKYLRSKNTFKIYSFEDLKHNTFQLKNIYSNFIDDTHVKILKNKEIKAAKIRWYRGYSLDGRRTYLPMSLIAYLLEGTNGMAAGNSLEEALLHAICEVIERHCLSLIKINKLKTPLIDMSTINSSIAKELIKKMQLLKYPILVKDFSLGIGLPVIGVIRKVDKTNCIITAGVATTREEALIRALLENSQTESKENYIKIHLAKYYFVNNKIISIKDIPNVNNKSMKLELEKIEKILNKQKMKIFFIDTTDKILNIPSVIVYITGAKFFSKETSYRNILIGLIEEYLRNENYSDIERYLNKADKIDKNNKLIYFYFRGLILKHHSRYREAIQYLSKVTEIKIAEFQKISLINLGLCYQAINDMDNAIDCYAKAIDLFPDFSIEYLRFYYDNVPLLFNNRNLFDNAKNLYYEIKLFRKHFPIINLQKIKTPFYKYQKNKKNILIHLEKTQTHFISKQYKKAIEEANKITGLSNTASKMHNVYLILGFCYEKTKQYKKAIRELKKAEKINPEEFQVNLSLSNCYKNIGQTEQANKELEKGVLKFKKIQQIATLDIK
ncbi:MAG: YcaO-like family protein [Candidatus Kaelpia imicola]|nr:YcaO-like family protein [Candidatus Kaelpia imicola]